MAALLSSPIDTNGINRAVEAVKEGTSCVSIESSPCVVHPHPSRSTQPSRQCGNSRFERIGNVTRPKHKLTAFMLHSDQLSPCTTATSYHTQIQALTKSRARTTTRTKTSTFPPDALHGRRMLRMCRILYLYCLPVANAGRMMHHVNSASKAEVSWLGKVLLLVMAALLLIWDR